MDLPQAAGPADGGVGDVVLQRGPDPLGRVVVRAVQPPARLMSTPSSCRSHNGLRAELMEWRLAVPRCRPYPWAMSSSAHGAFHRVHSRGAVNWCQFRAGSGGSQGLPSMAARMASRAVMPWAAAESR